MTKSELIEYLSTCPAGRVTSKSTVQFENGTQITLNRGTHCGTKRCQGRTEILCGSMSLGTYDHFFEKHQFVGLPEGGVELIVAVYYVITGKDPVVWADMEAMKNVVRS